MSAFFFIALIAVPLFLVFKWLSKSFIKKDRIQILAPWIATIILAPIIYVGLVYIFFSSLFNEPNRDFDRTNWLNNKTTRFQMAKHIIESRMLIKKDTVQIKQMLGDPSWKNDSLFSWRYDMGQGGGGLGFLFHYLNINLDSSHKVVSVSHTEFKD